MSTPFGDEDVNQDVKTRVANRQVQWGYLQDTGASPMGKPRSSSASDQPLMTDTFLAAEDFIRRLLEYDPRKRMSLTDARDHPWLAAQRAAQAAAAPPPVELELRRLYTIQEDFEDSDCPLHSPGDEGERLNRRDGAVCTWVCKFLLVAFDIA